MHVVTALQDSTGTCKQAITLRRTVLPGGTSSCCTAARSPKPLMSETCSSRHGHLLGDQQVGMG